MGKLGGSVKGMGGGLLSGGGWGLVLGSTKIVRKRGTRGRDRGREDPYSDIYVRELWGVVGLGAGEKGGRATGGAGHHSGTPPGGLLLLQMSIYRALSDATVG